MKQLGMAFIQYENDNDEYYTIGSEDTHKYGWAYAIYPYVKSLNVYSCPSDPYKAPNGYYACSYFMSWVMTGYKSASSQGGPAMMLRQLTAPALTVQLGECTKAYLTLSSLDKSPTSIGWGGNSTLSGGEFMTGPLGGPEYTSSAVYKTGTYTDGRHNLGANWLAMDGHVKWLMGTQVSPGYTYWPGSSYNMLPTWYENFGGTGNAAGTASMTDPSKTSQFVITFSGI